MKNVTFIAPVLSATVASTSGRMPRRRTDLDVMLRTWTTTVALSTGNELGHRAGLTAVAWQVLQQVADGVQAECVGRLSCPAPSSFSGASRRDGRG